MSPFQKETGIAAVLCLFLFGCFCYVGIVHTDSTGGINGAIGKEVVKNEDQQSCCKSVSQLF